MKNQYQRHQRTLRARCNTLPFLEYCLLAFIHSLQIYKRNWSIQNWRPKLLFIYNNSNQLVDSFFSSLIVSRWSKLSRSIVGFNYLIRQCYIVDLSLIQTMFLYLGVYLASRLDNFRYRACQNYSLIILFHNLITFLLSPLKFPENQYGQLCLSRYATSTIGTNVSSIRVEHFASIHQMDSRKVVNHD